MKKNITKQGPGRPKYTPIFPTRKQWTFLDLMDANEVNPNTGKGKRCTKLTLTKFLDRDLWVRAESKGKKKGKILRANPRSLVVRLDGIFAEPESKNGLGRKGFVYSLRAKATAKATKAPKATAPKATRQPRKARTAPQTDLSPATKTYEDIKAILATPEAAAVTVTPAPEVPATPTPAPAPEATAPAPEAVAAETAAVAAEATTAPSVS